MNASLNDMTYAASFFSFNSLLGPYPLLPKPLPENLNTTGPASS